MSFDEQEVGGEKYLLLYANWLQNLNGIRIDRFEICEQKPTLLPSPDLIVRYRVDLHRLDRRLMQIS